MYKQSKQGEKTQTREPLWEPFVVAHLIRHVFIEQWLVKKPM